jgi:hypothetical protein
VISIFFGSEMGSTEPLARSVIIGVIVIRASVIVLFFCLVGGQAAAWCDPSLPFEAYRECRNRPGEECPQPIGKTPRDQDLDRIGRPDAEVGMTAYQVRCETSWGSPNRVNTTTTAAGTTEQWVYTGGLNRSSYLPQARGYLYFRGGILFAIQK